MTWCAANRNRSRARRGRGFWVIDTVIGLFILVALAAALATATTRRHQAAARLADSRAADRVAERVLAETQATRRVPDAPASATPSNLRKLSWTVDAIDAPGTAPSGYRWARVTSIVNDRRADLIGLVPDTALPTGKGADK